MKNIHDDIDDWHKGHGGEIPLHVYLGMSLKDYAKWLEVKMTPEELAAFGYYED